MLVSICIGTCLTYGQQDRPTNDPPLPPVTTVQERHTIHLVYDDLALSDSARAKLISLLAHQPPADLKMITVTALDQGITKLIQNNFHLSGVTDRISVGALTDSIRSLNSLTSDTLIVG